MKAKITKIEYVDGQPLFCFRPGEIVEIDEIYDIPVNDGFYKEAFCIGSDGIMQSVPFDALEII